METSEVLNLAADLIEQRGWMRADGWVLPDTPDGAPVCLEGGIQAAAGITLPQHPMAEHMEPLQTCPAYRAVTDYLNCRGNLYIWNDYPDRTSAEVVEVLRACAVIEAARERQPVAAVS